MSDFLPPVAQRRLGVRVRDIHGDHVDDPWDWLRDPDDPEAIAHIEAENQWADRVTAPLKGLRATLVDEFRSLTVEDDVSAPVRDGQWWYFRRYQTGQSYPTHHRLPASGAPDELPPTLRPLVAEAGEVCLVDENAWAKGQEFFRLSNLTPNPQGSLIAWARDLSGDERWTWVVQDADGRIVDEAVTGAGDHLAWSADGQSFMYARVDDAFRSYQVWVHTVGTPAEEDTLLLWEPDEGFDVWIAPTRDPRFVAVHSASPTTSQAWLWHRGNPRSPLACVSPRLNDVLIRVEPAGDHLLVVHSLNSREGSVAAAPIPLAVEQWFTQEHAEDLTTPEALGGSLVPVESWVSVREPQVGERIVDIEAFSTFAVVSMRSESLTQVAVHLRCEPAHDKPLTAVEGVWGPGRFVTVESPVRTIMSAGVGDFDDTRFFIEHHSVTVPVTVELVEAASLSRHVIKRQQVPGWDPADYVEERVWVTARDGHTQIPVTLAYRSDLTPDGTHAAWMHGYGSYEIPFDAEFDILRLPALKRGVVHAIAHIRGGGEMGRAWYEDGKHLVKVNTFTDFIDVALWLREHGWAAPGRLAAEGRSAGGLLMGAVTNMAPDLFDVILAGVPFVDALTTILDPTLPLTVGEWEEWGNPITDRAVFDLMKTYTPYENVRDGVAYPAVMATTSINDTRVFYVEPAKWVLRLREANASNMAQRPIIMRTQMVAGHGGRSGRYGRWDARAEEFAFVLHQIGADS